MTATSAVVHVAAGVLQRTDGTVLINQRPAGKPHAGFWEFPGGKVESESAEAALRRELHEELGIDIGESLPLIRLRHAYPELTVDLEVFRVTRWSGEPHAREQQSLAWVHPSDLRFASSTTWPLLDADHPIINALLLPQRLLVTPEPVGDDEIFLSQLRRSVAGFRLLQFRAHSLSDQRYFALAEQVVNICSESGAGVILNRAPRSLDGWAPAGWHLDRHRLFAYRARPVAADSWLTAACHDRQELVQAAQLGVDALLVSPVHAKTGTADHSALGWTGFEQFARQANRPCYALGGMSADDVAEAIKRNGQGVAAIRAFWKY